MSFSWPFFPGLDQVLFSPWFSWFLGFDSKTVQRSALCRSRRELSNEYLLANFCLDTAENEPDSIFYYLIFYLILPQVQYVSHHPYYAAQLPSVSLSGMTRPAKKSAIFNQKIPKRCEGVHCVDLGESFPTSIYLQTLASIQPIISPVKVLAF